MDYAFGIKNEKSVIGILKSFFNLNLIRSDNKYSYFDYNCDSCFIELKSRRNSVNKYEDTMIGRKKILIAEKMNVPVHFVFQFTDGLYYWTYNKKDLLNGNIDIRIGGRNDRGIDEIQTYCFIKCSILKKISNYCEYNKVDKKQTEPVKCLFN